MKSIAQIFNQEEVLVALNEVENNEFIKKKFFPCLPLIVSGKEYTPDEVTEYFVIGIKAFFENRVNSEVIALILYGNIPKYISAIIVDEEMKKVTLDMWESNSIYLRKSKDFQKEIENLMKNKNNFTIFLKTPVQGKFKGAIAQSGNENNKLEVKGNIDTIDFLNEQDKVSIIYTRVYSDWPPSVSKFMLEDIEKVE